jgi:hypothetical protein
VAASTPFSFDFDYCQSKNRGTVEACPNALNIAAGESCLFVLPQQNSKTEVAFAILPRRIGERPLPLVALRMCLSLYGILANWRRTLVPGMAAHAWSDIYGGWLHP